jgi:DNA-binding IclR family transcriptional regulator
MLNHDDALTDTVLTAVTNKPGLTLRKLVKTLRAVADAGTIRATVETLRADGYLAQDGRGGRETYRRA